MSRKISLTRIHAINWYGYQESIPLTGNILLAGVTGSGKSILMDLIQLVLVGDRRMTRFNQSATGDRSTRDLKGYCLGDIKQDEGGVAQYMRQSAITYVALEFAWPSREKVETWGLRIEFASSAENKGRIEPFSFPEALSLDDFCPRDTENRRMPRDHAAFKQLVRDKEGLLYPEGIDRYRRDMASPGHLNFDPDLLGRLLPSAMSFTFLRSFDEFCRQFILPPAQLDVSDVTASYRAYQTYEKELVALREQLSMLGEIRERHAAMESARRDALLSRYLFTELEATAAREEKEEVAGSLARLQEAASGEAEALKKVEAEIAGLETSRNALDRAMHATPEGQLYSRIRTENKGLAAQIERLRERGRTLESALVQRRRRANAWRQSIEALPLEWPAKRLAAFDIALSRLEKCETRDAMPALEQLQSAANELIKEAQSAARPSLETLDSLETQFNRERDQIAMLEGGKMPFPTALRDTLNSQLPSTGRDRPAAHLRSLCEVRADSEDWRPAIEVAFTRKFAVIVEPSHFGEALRIYHDMSPAQLGTGARETLIDPTRALSLLRPIQPGSLAEKLETTHPVAAAIISHLFGDLICIESREELERTNASHAILRDGFQRRGAFVERTRHYDNHPFVGERGIQQQIEWKKRLLVDIQTQAARLTPLREAMAAANSEWKTLFALPADLHADIAETARIEDLERTFQANKLELDTIDRTKFETVETDLSTIEHNLREARTREKTLLANQKSQAIAEKEAELRNLTEIAESKTTAFEKIRFEEYASIHQLRLDELRVSKLAAFTTAIAAREFEKDAIKFEGDVKTRWTECHEARRLLAERYPRFEEIDIEAPDNTPYEAQYLRIHEAEVPDYLTKSTSERQNWEHYFRENVLTRLHAALREVERTCDLLRSLLHPHPIGDNRYSIVARRNPDFEIYHRLLSVSHSAPGDDLFYQNLESELRDTLDHFLKLLTERADSAETARLLDYRCYFDYRMLVTDLKDPEGRPTDLDRHAGKFSGGENQSPYFIAILASYLRAYKRHETRGRGASLALVPIDEAFSKLSGERIRDCIGALKAFDLQGVFSMSTGNIPYAFDLCDHLLAITKQERHVGGKPRIRNIAASIARDSPEAREFLDIVEE